MYPPPETEEIKELRQWCEEFYDYITLTVGTLRWLNDVSDGTARGDQVSGTVDQNTVGFGGCLRLGTDGNWDDADKDAVATCGELALAIDVGTGDDKALLIEGFVNNSSWSFTAADQLYVGDSGAITATAPSASGDVVQVVGYAYSATLIHFNPSPDYLVLA